MADHPVCRRHTVSLVKVVPNAYPHAWYFRCPEGGQLCADAWSESDPPETVTTP